MVEGVGYPYVAKGHLLSGQVREKEGGMAVWDHPGREEDSKVLWASHTWPQVDRCLEVILVKGPLRGLKGGV